RILSSRHTVRGRYFFQGKARFTRTMVDLYTHKRKPGDDFYHHHKKGQQNDPVGVFFTGSFIANIKAVIMLPLMKIVNVHPADLLVIFLISS
ncbi:hypothetical protein ACFLXQ_07880, partial [Chloroflexota bacterium]